MTEMMRGQIHIYTGNGKGKSTASFGLAVRAAGHGKRVAIIQFMKNGEDYGETKAMTMLPGVEMHAYGSKHFVRKGAAQEEDIRLAEEALAHARRLMADESVDLLVLDEICNAIWFELLKEEDILMLVTGENGSLTI